MLSPLYATPEEKLPCLGKSPRVSREAFSGTEAGESFEGSPMDAEAFWFQVDMSGKCWLWKGSSDKDGYGKFADERAHRVAWSLSKGPIPPGKYVLHKCDNPPCVRPSHLFLGDAASNKADCVAKGRHTFGERIWQAKLNEAQVIAIRAATGSQQKIADKYGVSQVCISSIRSRRTWKHVK